MPVAGLRAAVVAPARHSGTGIPVVQMRSPRMPNTAPPL
jgi:hypothetical protein